MQTKMIQALTLNKIQNQIGEKKNLEILIYCQKKVPSLTDLLMYLKYYI